MKTYVLNKIVSVFLIVLISLNLAFPIFAEDPTVTPDPTPTDQVATTEANLSDQNGFVGETTDSTVITVLPDGTTNVATNSGDLTTIDTQDTSSLTTDIQNTNDTDVTRTVDDQNTTGGNTAIENIVPYGTVGIVTGEAGSIQNISTIVNTNIVADSASIVLKDVFTDNNESINLSSIAPCQASGIIDAPESLYDTNSGNNVKILDTTITDTTLVIRNDNTANINNIVKLDSDTGNNSAIDNISGVVVETGDASTQVNIFTMANTNLTGNCWFYGVINLFGSQNGDIILPYELDILHNSIRPLVFQTSTTTNTGDTLDVSTENASTSSAIINNTNDAQVTEDVASNTNTGENSLIDTINFNTIGSIITGDATTQKNIIDILNTNYVLNHFFFLQINRYGNWNGQIVGLDSQYIMLSPSDLATAGLSPLSTVFTNSGDDVSLDVNSVSTNTLVVENNNNLLVNNAIDLNSNTGNNEAGRFNASIKTGNANNRANIVTMGNTNITGDNWYYMVINIFDDFFGNIVFARPDMVISKVVDQAFHNAGDTFSYTIAYANQGNTFDTDVFVTDVLPEHLHAIHASNGGIIGNGTVEWNLGKVNAGQTGFLTLLVISEKEMSAQDIVNSAVISGSRSENNSANNTASVSVKILCVVNCPGPASSQSTSPQTNTTSQNAQSLSQPEEIVQNTVLGATNGRVWTVTTGKSKTKSNLADCGLACQAKMLKTDQSILTILSVLLIGLALLRKKVYSS